MYQIGALMTLLLHLKAAESFSLNDNLFFKPKIREDITQPKQQRTKQQEEKTDTSKIQTAAESICPYDAVKSVQMGSVSSAVRSQRSTVEWI